MKLWTYMRLKNVTLHNFRCFDRLDLPLHERLTVIVAENGGGKTAILDGIAVALSQAIRHLSSANQRISGPGFKDTDFRLVPKKVKDEVRWITSPYTRVEIETTCGLRWDCSKVSVPGTRDPDFEKIGSQQLAAEMSRVLANLESDAPSLVPVFAYYGANRGWLPVPGRIRDSKVNYEYPTSALVGCLNPLSDFKEMLKWFDGEEAKELRMNRDYPLQVSGIDVPTTSPALACVREAIERLLGGNYSDPMIDQRRKFVIHSNKEPKVLQISQLSQGYQSMLALGMDFARRLALANPHMQHIDGDEDWMEPVLRYVQAGMGDVHDLTPIGPTWAPAVMLIDEVDLHLHPSWQQRVLGDLMRAFPGTQFIVTTHSPQVLTTVRKENIRIIDKDMDGKWVARMPDRNPYAHSSSLALEAIMGGAAYPALLTTEFLREYQQLVGADQHDSPRAFELRKVLEREWGTFDPELMRVDISIRKNETLRRLRAQKAD